MKSWTGNADLDGIIRREIRYGQTRWTEVWLSLSMLIFGFVFLGSGDTFTLPSYVVIRTYITEDHAGWIGLVVGLMRLLALYINGRVNQTPIIRVLGCASGFFFFSTLALGYWLSSPPWSAGVHLSVWALAELHALHRASGDLFVADSFGLRARRRRDGRSPARD